MAIKAIFVGINKHFDIAISELGRACHDATALWALFTDMIEGLNGRLLVDKAVTHTEVSEAMLGTLGLGAAALLRPKDAIVGATMYAQGVNQ